MSLTSTVNRGFHMEFKNGVLISVQWGYGNYCKNKDLTKDYLATMENTSFSCDNAEIMIEKDGKAITKEYADFKGLSHDGLVIGWLNSDDVLEAMIWAREY